MKKSLFSIAGIFALGTLAAVGQLVFPGKKSLADIAETYRDRGSVIEVEEAAYASDGARPERADQRASLAQDADQILNQLEHAEDTIIDNGSQDEEEPVDDNLREARVRELEAQQQSFIAEIARLKKALESRSEPAAAVQPAVQPVAVAPGDNSKDKENLRLLANHILQLRENLKAEKEMVSLKTAEVESLKKRLSEMDKQTGDARRASGESEERTKQLESAIASLREKIAALEADKKGSADALKAKEMTAEQTENELEDTKRQLSKTIQDAKSCGMSLEKQNKVSAELPGLKSKMGGLESAIAQRDKEIATLKTQLADREQIVGSIPAMKKELLAAKNELLMKEKEIQLATKAVSVHTGASQEERDKLLEQSGRRAGEESIHGKSDIVTDVMIVEVLGSRVALRSGPSPDDSEIMPVGKGTRLTVEERIGEWYRVIAPNSMRAYIRSDMVRVISGGSSASSRVASSAPRAPKKVARQAVRPEADMEAFGSVDRPPTTAEQRALERLRQGMEGARPTQPEMIP